jgi:hypothetical protein
MKMTRRQLILASGALIWRRLSHASSLPLHSESVIPVDGFSFSIQYGMDNNFELYLTDCGKFWFTIGSNSPSLFPQPEIGNWQGTDTENGKLLCQLLTQSIHAAPENAPSLPGAPVIAISKIHKGESRTALYSLESPPPAIKAALKNILQHVNGPWRDARKSTLAAQVIANDPVKIALQLHASGPDSVTIPLPVANSACELLLAVNTSSESVSYTDRLLKVTTNPTIPSAWQSSRGVAPLLTLPAGEHISLALAPVGVPDNTCYSATVRLRLLAPIAPVKARDVVQGVLTLGPVKWCTD